MNGPRPVPQWRIDAHGDLTGYVRVPGSAVWQPDADVLWTPPGSKSGPDILGHVTDVEPLDDVATWVKAQLAKRARYVEALRAMLDAGKLALTPELARLLGISGPSTVVGLRVKSIGELPRRDGPIYEREPSRWVSYSGRTH